jgi:hypothetical protein
MVGTPYLRGKLIAVHWNEGLLASSDLDRTLQESVPPDLQARRPEDVGTLLIRKRADQSVGDYVYKEDPDVGKQSRTAMRICDDLRIIDLSIPAIIQQKTLLRWRSSCNQKEQRDAVWVRPVSGSSKVRNLSYSEAGRSRFEIVAPPVIEVRRGNAGSCFANGKIQSACRDDLRRGGHLAAGKFLMTKESRS